MAVVVAVPFIWYLVRFCSSKTCKLISANKRVNPGLTSASRARRVALKRRDINIERKVRYGP